MPSQPSRTSEATVDDPLPYQTPLAALVRQVRARRLAILGLASLAVSLIATAPARIVISPASDGAANAVGTIWNGEVAIGEQTAVSWRLAPIRSILSLGVASDVMIRGGAHTRPAATVRAGSSSTPTRPPGPVTLRSPPTRWSPSSGAPDIPASTRAARRRGASSARTRAAAWSSAASAPAARRRTSPPRASTPARGCTSTVAAHVRRRRAAVAALA